MKIFIVDTNTLLNSPSVLKNLSEESPYQVVILKVVLGELDGLKHAEGQTGYQAREASRWIDEITSVSPRTSVGWQISMFGELVIDEKQAHNRRNLIEGESVDDVLLKAVAEYQKSSNAQNVVSLLTSDRNLQLLARNRFIDCVDSNTWVQVAQNTFILPNLPSALYWQKGGGVYFQLPVSEQSEQIGTVEIFPFFGFENGGVVTYHIRFFEPTFYQSQDPSMASPLLILSTTGKVNYAHQLENLPTIIHKPINGGKYFLSHKGYKVTINVPTVEMVNPVKLSGAERQLAYQNLTSGTVLGSNIFNSIARGMQMGSAIRVLKAENFGDPIFTKLSLRIQITPMSENERPSFEQKVPAPPSKESVLFAKFNAQPQIIKIGIVVIGVVFLCKAILLFMSICSMIFSFMANSI